jgi:hypothetical protein
MTHRMTTFIPMGLLLTMGLAMAPLHAENKKGATEYGFPTVPLSQLPEPLRNNHMKAKPDMTDRSRCAAAFDSSSEFDKMTLQCSIYVRMAAEGARRAMAHCEEKRLSQHIHGPCRIVVE